MARVGGYKLGELIAEGGMGAVWRCTSPATSKRGGRPVALKLIRAGSAEQSAYRDAIRNEVHLTARLNHPGIIELLDWGEVTAEEAAELGSAEGSPWIAMELAEASFHPGSIKDWETFREFAVALLEALAHAHARGVVHRDLKPGNILTTTTPSGATRYIITDLGIALPSRLLQRAESAIGAPSAGTLNYMAPEQLLGRWRDFGPYTDLFSLGVLFQQIVTGYFPFDAPSRIKLGLQHQAGAAAFGSTRFGVPDGLEEWVAGLLRFDPRERFAVAADALHPLLQLAPATQTAPHATAIEHEEPPTLPLGDSDTLQGAPLVYREWGGTVHIAGETRAPFAASWRSDQDGVVRPFAGTKLFGLRRTPMTGREEERDVAWAQLSRAVEHGRGHGLVLRGSAGVGKSRLAQWLCERAHELGAAEYVELEHSPGGSALPRMLRQQLRLWGQTQEQSRRRVKEVLQLTDDSGDLQTIDRLLGGESVGLGEQTMLLGRLLSHFATQRPLIVWLDDAHWSLEAIEAAARLTALPAPVLFVLTVRAEELARLPIQREQIREYAALREVVELSIGPLPPSQMSQLLDEALSLADHTREELVATADGNPLQALQRLQLSVQRGDLTTADEVVSGQVSEQSAERLWAERMQQVDDAREAMLAAAVLGARVDADVWQGVCASCGIQADVTIAHRFVEAGLWSPVIGGWIFEHSSLREAVLKEAQDSLELAKIHRAAAELYDREGARTFIPHGFHRIHGGELRDGINVLLNGLTILYAEGRGLTARSLAASLRELVDERTTDEWTVARLEVAEAGISLESMRYDECLQNALRVADISAERGWPEIGSRAHGVLAACFEFERSLDQALTHAQQSLTLARQAGQRDLQDRAACRLGWALARLSRHTEAKHAFIPAIKAPNRVLRDRAHLGLAQTYRAMGQPDEAMRHLDASIEFARDTGRRAQLADALNSRAGLSMELGDHEGADRDFDEAYNNSKLEPGVMQRVILLNWAVLLSRMGRFDEARANAITGLEGPLTHTFIASYGRLVRLFNAGLAGWPDDWTEFADALEDPVFTGDLEFAEMFTRMAESWHAADDIERSSAAQAAARRVMHGSTNPTAVALEESLLKLSQQ